jgi:membrane-associated phospholipid phosphatase
LKAPLGREAPANTLANAKAAQSTPDVHRHRLGVDCIAPPLRLRPSEWLFCAFFLYVAALSVLRDRHLTDRTILALTIPVALVALASIDTTSSRRVWTVLRDWLGAVLVLVAYWSVDWMASRTGDGHLEQALIGWDRTLLNEWGLRAAIESVGVTLPMLLETTYLLVYSVLPLIIAVFYIQRRRNRLEDFLLPFLIGTLTAYALLPHFPTQAPRFLFPSEDLPRFDTAVRRLNLWILDHGDIRSSIFPSGHVAFAFSAAFATRLAVPAQRRVAWALFFLAVLVWLDTIYGRYHYAADGLAGLIASAVPIGGLALWQLSARRSR